MSASSSTVLIVEDFLPDQELYRRYLLADSSHAYCFLEAATAATALKLCQTQAVDAILLDYRLPDANGLTFLESLHTQCNGNSPPVVVVTGQGDEIVAARAIKLGAEDYLVKSRLTPDLLRLTVRSAIENARLRLQLRESDDRFQVSIENMLDCFGIYSAIRDQTGQIVDFRIDYLNAAALQNNRMTRADLGKGLCELLPAHRETGLFEECCRVVETGEPLAKEELIYSDVFGTHLLTRAFDVHASKLNDGFVASWRDVTARKQAELERRQQHERERIVHQITQQIRRFPLGETAKQPLDLEEVLNTTVTEVREHLGTDRAFLYRFAPDFSGRIVVESVVEGLPAVIGAEVQDTCFMETHGEDYRQGRIQAVEDIYTAGLTDCHVEMLARFQIRANLVVPILQGEHLWGLLVLSQCACPRPWQPLEVDLVQQLAAQIGIAIRQAELHQQAQESQQRYQQLADAMPQMVWTADATGLVNYWNQRWYEYSGLGEAESIGLAGVNTIHPEDRERTLEQWGQSVANGDPFEIEYRVRRWDGDYRWFISRGIATRDSHGKVTGWIGTITNIDELKRSQTEREQLLDQLAEEQQRLQQSEERLQLGVRVAGLAIAHVDYASNQVTLSPEAAALFGIPANELVVTREQTYLCPRERVHATFHPDERDELFAIIQQVLDPAGEGWFAREHRVVWQTGEVRWLSVRKQVFFDRSGATPRPDYAILAAIDITDKKETEAILRESEAHLRYTVELNPQVPWMADPDGRITRFNGRWLELTGMTREQASGDGWVQAPHPDDRPAMVAAWTHSIQTGEPYDVEHRIKLTDGSYRWMRSRAFPRRSEQGEIVQWYGTTEDIDDRKQIEFEREELLQREQAARAEAGAANRSKDDFVSLVAHELRSPLNAIMGWAQLLQSRQLDGATTARALETIRRNTQAQVQLVEDLLDVSRMVRGTLQLTLESVNLTEVVEEAIETVRPTAEAKGLRLETQLDRTVPISGDPNRLRQVVLNLLTNAIKFTPADGQVEVRLDQHDAQARLQVRDTGKGISPDFLPHIFERFRQDQQNATAEQGLGLGLAIVKHLVESHRGTVTVESQGEDLGATFTVMLPLLQSGQDGE